MLGLCAWRNHLESFLKNTTIWYPPPDQLNQTVRGLGPNSGDFF